MKHLLYKLFYSQDGYGTVELLLIILGVATTCSTVVGKLLPAIKNIYTTSSQAVIQPSQSGY